VLGSSVSFIDTSAVTVALPAIDRDLDAGLTGLQWTIDGYVLCLAALMVVSGALGDRLGRRRVFVIGLVSFAVASALCAAAWSIESLIAARALQGVAGSLMIPNSLAVLRASFPRARQGEMMGAWTAWSGITSVIGPFLGGWLVDNGSWRLIFALNLPILAAAVFLALRYVPAFDPENPEAPIDWVAIPLVIGGFGGITFGLIERSAWSVAVGVVLLVALVLAERRRRHPMIPLTLFRIRNFAAGNVATVLIYASLGGSLFLQTLFLQKLAGFSALGAGAVFVPATICLVLLASRFGRLADTLGPRWFMAGGPVLIGVAMVWLASLSTNPDFVRDLLAPMVVLGLGLSVVVAPLTSAVLGAAPSRHAGVASAINTSMSRAGTMLAVAAVGLSAHAGFDRSAYHDGMLMCAGLALGGAIVSALGISNVATDAED
jgi:EmrB/QacA subfamily drug resistance transporter